MPGGSSTAHLYVFEDLTFGIIAGCLIAALLAGIDRWRGVRTS